MSVYRRGKVWWIDFVVDGKRARKPVGSSKKKATDALDRIKGKIASDDYKPDEKVDAPPFELAVEDYTSDREAKGKNEKSYQYLVGLWTDLFKKRRLASISTVEITNHLDRWQIDKRWSGGTRNRVAAQLSGFMSFAVRRRWIREHPMERGRVSRQDESDGRTRWLRRHEIDLLRAKVHEVEGIDDDWRQVLDDVIVFASSTGVRFGRVCDLRRADYADGFIVIDKDKNGERVHIPVAGDLEPLVERRVEVANFSGSYLFPGPKGGNARASIRRWLPRIVRAAGLVWGKYEQGEDGKALRDKRGRKVLDPDGITFHTFRHSMASNAFDSGVIDAEIQKLGHWKDPKMLDRYRHIGDDRLREAAARVVAHVAGSHTTVTTPQGQRPRETSQSNIACDTKPVSRVGR